MFGNFGYADRYLVSQNPDILSERVNSVADENDDEDFGWHKGKKLSYETNKRRKRQQQKLKKTADAEEKRRQEILTKRREKLKEATDRYQKCRSTKKAVEKKMRAKSGHDTTAFTNKDLEDTLKLLQGYQNTNGHENVASRKTESRQHIYSLADTSFTEKYSENNPSVIRAKNHGIESGYPRVSSADAHKTQFERQLEEYQSKNWEEQKKSMIAFGDVINTTLKEDVGSDNALYEFEEPVNDVNQNVLEDSLDQESARTFIRESGDIEQKNVPQVFESFDIETALKPELFTRIPEPPCEPKPVPNERNGYQRVSPRTVIIPHTKFLPADTQAQAEDNYHLDVSSDTEDDIETDVLEDERPKSILKKFVDDFNENIAFPNSNTVPVIKTKEVLTENKVTGLRDSIEISRINFMHKVESPKQPVSRKKSVRFAEKLCHEHELTSPHYDITEKDRTNVVTSVQSHLPIPAKPKPKNRNQGRILSGNHRSKPKLEPDFTTEGHRIGQNGINVKIDIPPSTDEVSLVHKEAGNIKKDAIEVTIPTGTKERAQEEPITTEPKSCSMSTKPPPTVQPSVAHLDMPGYADLSKKPPKVFKPKPRPSKVTTSTLNRFISSQSPVMSPVSTPSKISFGRSNSSSGVNSPTVGPCASDIRTNHTAVFPKRTVSDPNLHKRTDDIIVANQSKPIIDLQDRQIALDKTPTDQDIDWLWSKVRECLNRSTSSIAATESELSIQSAPNHTRGNMSNQLIDGSHFAQIGSAANRKASVGFPPRASSANRAAGLKVVHHHHNISSHNRRIALLKQREPLPVRMSQSSTNEESSSDLLGQESSETSSKQQVFVSPPKEHLRVINETINTNNSVTESLAEFLANEAAVSSVDNSAASSPRNFVPMTILSPNSSKAMSLRRGTMLRQREREAPLSLQPHPPPPKVTNEIPVRIGSAQQQRSNVSQLSVEEQRLMKSLERLNDKLKTTTLTDQQHQQK